MTRASWNDIKNRKIRGMTKAERAEYDQGYAEAKLAAEVGERVRQAREAAGLSQRDLASRMGTSRARGGPTRSRRCWRHPHNAAARRVGARSRAQSRSPSRRVASNWNVFHARVTERVSPDRRVRFERLVRQNRRRKRTSETRAIS